MMHFEKSYDYEIVLISLLGVIPQVIQVVL